MKPDYCELSDRRLFYGIGGKAGILEKSVYVAFISVLVGVGETFF